MGDCTRLTDLVRTFHAGQLACLLVSLSRTNPTGISRRLYPYRRSGGLSGKFDAVDLFRDDPLLIRLCPVQHLGVVLLLVIRVFIVLV